MVEEYFQGTPLDEFFRVDRRKAIVIGCSEYGELREQEGFEAFQDIPESMSDVKVVKAGLRRLDFDKEDIHVLLDPSFMDIKLAIGETCNTIIRSYMEEEQNTLLFVYFAGHGSMDNTTKAMLNGKRHYPLEKSLRNLAKCDGSYVMGVFDCCREKLDASLATRGGGGAADILDDEDDDDNFNVEDSQENFIMTYGCQPSSGVPQKSTISQTYFRYLRMKGLSARDQSCRFVLPYCLNFFQNSDGKCEHHIKAAKPLLLTWHDQVKEGHTGDKFGISMSKYTAERESAANDDGMDEAAEQENDEEEEDQEGIEKILEENEGVQVFDFSEPVEVPDVCIKINNMRLLQNIHLLPNKHLLIEGGLMEQAVEVYQLEQNMGEVEEPIHVIEAGARGLNAVEHTDTEIFMGFMGSLSDPNLQLQVYNFDYELTKALSIGGTEALCWTDMSLVIDNQFIVGSHVEGHITVINLETDTFELIESPFGPIDSISGVEVFEPRPEDSPQTLFLPSTEGVYMAVITPDGNFIACMGEEYYPGVNVSNAVILNEDEMLLSIQEEAASRLVIINLDTKEEKIIIKPNKNFQVLDICKIPILEGETSYFIMHAASGIHLVNPAKKKTYVLSNNEQSNFNVCKSIVAESIDPEDPSQGFWLAQIDNGKSMEQAVKAFDFNQDFMLALKQLDEQAAN